MKIKNATGTKGFLLEIHVNGTPKYVFRVYNEDRTFTDYEIRHFDLEMEILDLDATFYEGKNGRLFLDYSPATLGIEDEINR
jgi:hypothetical protein